MSVTLNPNIQTAYAQSFKAKEGGEKKTGGVGKAVASAIIPGSGQLIDGRAGSGLGFFCTLCGLSLVRSKLMKPVSRALDRYTKILDKQKLPLKESVKKSWGAVNRLTKTMFKNASMPKKIAMVALPVAIIGTYVANVVNAYKGDKK